MRIVCELCQETIGEAESLSLPLRGLMFSSPDAFHDFPPPFPSEVGWMDMRCPYGPHRPFIEENRVLTDKGYIDVMASPVPEIEVDAYPEIKEIAQPEIIPSVQTGIPPPIPEPLNFSSSSQTNPASDLSPTAESFPSTPSLSEPPQGQTPVSCETSSNMPQNPTTSDETPRKRRYTKRKLKKVSRWRKSKN